MEYVQIGKATLEGAPLSREVNAIYDIQTALSLEPVNEMGRQINFYMTKQDEERFIEFAKGTANISILLNISNSRIE